VTELTGVTDVTAVTAVTGASPTLAAIEVPTIGPDATVAELVRASLLANVAHLVAHEPIARRDEDPEGVHQARVAIRRTRSNLRTYRDLLEPAWWRPLDAELKRQAALLGSVRDADVLGARLRAAIAGLPAHDRSPASFVLDRLAGERARSFAALAAELDAPAHADFVARLAEMVAEPVFAEGADSAAGGTRRSTVDRPAAELVPTLVARPWRKLRKEVRALPPAGDAPPPELHEKLHEVRIRAKRARYACEAVRPVVGKPARRLAKRLGDLQDVLGDLHDTAVAEDWLRAAAADVRIPRSAALAAGLLVAREREQGAGLLAEWPGAWSRVTDADAGWIEAGRG
jgi:CHAD domain-containing protein